MLKFTTIVILAFFNIQMKVNAAPSLTEEDLKDQLMVTIVEAKNRAYDQILGIKALAANKPEKFINTVNEMVEKAWYDIETLKQESGNINDAVCDEKNNINNNALKTISHYQNCIEKVIESADADMSYLASDGDQLRKEIEYATNINEELRNRVTDIEERSYKFGKYLQNLEKCDTQSNLIRLKRQISEALTR